jgi:hypothetical protein
MSNVKPENKVTYYKGVYYFGNFRTHKFGGYWKVYDESKYPHSFQFMTEKLKDAKNWMLAQGRR